MAPAKTFLLIQGHVHRFQGLYLEQSASSLSLFTLTPNYRPQVKILFQWHTTMGSLLIRTPLLQQVMEPAVWHRWAPGGLWLMDGMGPALI